MSLFTVIRYLDQTANFGYRGEPKTKTEYESALIWHEDRDAPSWADVQAAWDDAHLADALVLIRAKRDELLSESDWTQLPDAPVNAKAWAVYRQALRDLPAMITDPAEPIEWPEPPK